MKIAVTKKDVVRYVFLPGIRPRMRDFAKDGFTSLAFIIALIYNAVGILPSNHPYLRSDMLGQYGIRHVISEAKRHLKFSWKHIDQILIFFAIFLGIVLLAVQFALVLVSFFAKSAHAAAIGLPASLHEYVLTENPDQDIAFRLLDMVFGIPGFFGSQELTYLNVMADFHEALHGMFIIYSLGIIVIGALIVSYFIGAVLIETAQTGTPFGKRFNHVWVPVRIIVAFGLLIPIGFGMNAGQFITLNAAKWGSGFATNGWIYFNQIVAGGGGSYIGERETLVALPRGPEVSHLQSFSGLMLMCDSVYEGEGFMEAGYQFGAGEIEAYIVKGTGDAAEYLIYYDTPFEQALEFSEGGQIHIKIGRHDTTYTDEIGMVKAYCGELIIDTFATEEPGFELIQEGYYYLGQALVYNNSLEDPCGVFVVLSGTQAVATTYAMVELSSSYNRGDIAFLEDMLRIFHEDGTLEEERQILKEVVDSCALLAQAELAASDTWNIDEDGLNLGWAGAAIWYNKLAQVNGGFVTALNQPPRIYKYPLIMEYVLEQKLQQDDNINPSDRFKPEMEQGKEIEFQNPNDPELARVFNIGFQYWEERGYGGDALRTHAANQENSFIDTINAIFGTQGLFDMCQNTNIHPLAQMAALGKGLIEAAIRNLGYSLASGVMGGAAYILSPHMGSALGAASGFFSTIAGIGLVIGFLLYYVIPFMPFLYFFFAVGGWVKGIFEAMVGVPLWALAHLRIDGEGLPGPGGSYGYFLILEIFLRPFMIVLGLLASITIYAAMVRVLNDIFYLVVSNIAGHDPVDRNACTITDSTNLFELGQEQYLRGPVDEFFFTVLYAIIVYMIGMSSFKLIDQIPNEIMRWMGANVKTFNDERGETAEGLTQRITIGGGAIMGKLQGAAQQGGSFFSSAGQGLLKQLKSGDNGGQ